MNKSQIHEFLAGPIENVVHLDFKHAKRVPELVEEAVKDVDALEDIENLEEILASKNWQVFKDFKSENFDFEQKADVQVIIKDFMLAFTEVDNVYYVFKVEKIYYNQYYYGIVDSKYLRGGLVTAESANGLYAYLIETLREEFGTYTAKQIVQLKNL